MHHIFFLLYTGTLCDYFLTNVLSNLDGIKQHKTLNYFTFISVYFTRAICLPSRIYFSWTFFVFTILFALLRLFTLKQEIAWYLISTQMEVTTNGATSSRWIALRKFPSIFLVLFWCLNLPECLCCRWLPRVHQMLHYRGSLTFSLEWRGCLDCFAVQPWIRRNVSHDLCSQQFQFCIILWLRIFYRFITWSLRWAHVYCTEMENFSNWDYMYYLSW